MRIIAYLAMVSVCIGGPIDDISNVDLDHISADEIEATVIHLHERNVELKMQLEIEQAAHADAVTHVASLQVEINNLTIDRNDQAKAKDSALNERDAAKAVIEKQKAHIKTLKYVVCGAGALIVLTMIIMVGLPGKAMPYGIIATIAIPTLIFGVLMKII